MDPINLIYIFVIDGRWDAESGVVFDETEVWFKDWDRDVNEITRFTFYADAVFKLASESLETVSQVIPE